MASAYVEENRRAVPIGQFITSNSPEGILMCMDIYIDGSKLDEYIRIVTPVVHKMREYSECLFCEISKNPSDQGHIRIQHGWTKTSDWIRNVSPGRRKIGLKDRKELSLILLPL